MEHSRTTVAPARSAHLLIASGALLFILLLVLASLKHLRPPALPSSEPPLTQFSTARALDDLRQIAKAPHPTGSPENAAVREYLLGRLRALGHSPELQSGQVFNAELGGLATISNIVVRIPGSARTEGGKALLLAAHYDSAPSSPGAADDGAAIAAILETLRLLKAGAPLRNDLLVLLTDGEEAGLFGSQLFVERLGKLHDIGAVLNFEFRGNRGPIWLFETSGGRSGNGRLIEAWQRSLSHPVGNSLLAEVYRHLPNDTDMSNFKRAGLAGLNFAGGEGHTSYHSQLDTVERIDTASMQHLGASMVELVQRLGNEDLQSLESGDAVFFDMPLLGAVSYPAALALPLQLVVLALLAILVVHSLRRGQLRFGKTLTAVPALLVSVVVVALLCQLVWTIVWFAHPGYQLMQQGSTYNGDVYLGAFAALGLALFVGALKLLRRWFAAEELRAGALLAYAALGLIIAAALPGASYLLLWPVLPFLVLGLIGSIRGQLRTDVHPGPVRALLLGVASVPAVLLFVPVVQLLFEALTPQALYAMVAVQCLALLPALSLLELLTRRFLLPLVPAVLGVGLLALGSVSAGFDAERPKPDNLFFVQDADANKAYWISEDDELDPFTARFFGSAPKPQALPELFGGAAIPLWVNAAAPLTQPGPLVKVLEDKIVDGARQLTIQVSSQRQAPRLRVAVEDIEVRAAKVAGHDYRSASPRRWRIDVFGTADEPVELSLSVSPGQPFAVRVRDISYGLPAHALGARPADLMIQPFRNSDTTQLIRLAKFAG
ncbi:M28 family peptidase [Paucibacter sp. APW11]|uniref:M28 family peptidase n=1 Tax=Roseateles aquae TaxID=3077235 RepID=A0ABU3PIY6_9BURK|nr:M28 family peptidase [Paucibacter sp. APW11]MDT9002107.1 M28 family peptidase [Paucibacter sp. APW11]